MEHVVDIHSHMVYGVDDGSPDFESSVKMLRMAKEQGAEAIFCTSHSWGIHRTSTDYENHFCELKKIVLKEIPGLQIFRGCEIECKVPSMKKILERIRNGEFPTMNGTNYVLAEFYPYSTKNILQMTECLEAFGENGYTPIIAHAERYEDIYSDPVEDLKRLKQLGCLVQMNLFSVAQDWNPDIVRLANLLLENHLVDLVGSDAHRLDHRPPNILKGAKALRERYGNEYADKVLFRNAEELLIGS